MAPWTLQSYANQRAETCLSQQMPDVGTGTTCLDKQATLAGRDLYAIHGGKRTRSTTHWDDIFVYGYVSARVTQLELVHLDCSLTEIPVDADGVFSYVADQNDIVAGRAPYRLVARDRAVKRSIGKT